MNLSRFLQKALLVKLGLVGSSATKQFNRILGTSELFEYLNTNYNI